MVHGTRCMVHGDGLLPEVDEAVGRSVSDDVWVEVWELLDIAAEAHQLGAFFLRKRFNEVLLGQISPHRQRPAKITTPAELCP